MGIAEVGIVTEVNQVITVVFETSDVTGETVGRMVVWNGGRLVIAPDTQVVASDVIAAEQLVVAVSARQVLATLGIVTAVDDVVASVLD